MKLKFKKIGVLNFSGNVGKSVIANHLLLPRMNGAKLIEVETSNAGAFDHQENTRFKGKQFESVIEEMMLHDSVVVDIGASNLEDLLKFMNTMAGSHEDFDLFVVPVTPDKKQQIDTIKTINSLSKLGVSSDKIRVVFNKLDLDDVSDVQSIFSTLFAVQFADKNFTICRDAVLIDNPVYDRLRYLRKTVTEMAHDKTDYTAMRRMAADADGKEEANKLLTAQRLSRSAKVNLDSAFEALIH